MSEVGSPALTLSFTMLLLLQFVTSSLNKFLIVSLSMLTMNLNLKKLLTQFNVRVGSTSSDKKSDQGPLAYNLTFVK